MSREPMRKSSRLYVGGLPMDIKDEEVEDLFYKFGDIRTLDLKIPMKPPAFAFVEFADWKAAERAMDALDGYDFFGSRIMVHISYGTRSFNQPPPSKQRDQPLPSKQREMGMPKDFPRELPPFPIDTSRRTYHRAIVENLPRGAAWQDLKDHVVPQGHGGWMGLTDYATAEELDTAVRRLNGSQFIDRSGRGRAIVRVTKEHQKHRGRSRSRSPIAPPRTRAYRDDHRRP
ncbi:hypothetical protein DUNSADRAFT_10462 [Dunaliella salina]|uniref:RRM domain-containing protein n=1 Tax=Dunaliella salina TaxID=3046 RepID=A0ABQ7GFA9_DUNSA|nr:hypothetical protein DUNSADRAFT_10462 [Dunaliella salina]|eukprot:KAF5833297.1 hypothetical protein DUNSADRAFT_10462 [Dunaliella salina]